MIPTWTGKLVGEMHLHQITVTDLARKLGLSREFVSRVINGRYGLKDAEERFTAALNELIKERKHES